MLLKRLAQAVVTMFIAVIAIFLAVRALPANPVIAQFGQHAVPEKIEKEMEERGWNKPLWQQTLSFVGQLGSGDLGESFARPGEKISSRLSQAIPATLELTFAAMMLAIPLGIFIGTLAALWRGAWPDWISMALALLGVSVPVFFLAICLIAAFPAMPSGLRLPPGTFHNLRTEFYFFESLLTGNWQLAAMSARHLILPAIALSTIPLAVISRITRNSMLEVLDSDYLRTARAKGASLTRMIARHAFPNASLSVLNIVGFQFGMLLSGAILTETVFNWPGLGRYVVDAIRDYDYSVVQACALVMAAIFVTLNLTLDVLFLFLDPRLRDRGQA
ncbi:ABC transporter permease [Bremerella sp. T1]|uniref:ABC transporter permease n=1 Tax=Bremerella sp. TYQ1 TaxID=3119568 RepID=UPI001CCC3000|nr:ABC transporter permease [Bremerella volcania]UBM38926.1 ABC transporter permease [Bremerella volcania]